MDFSNRLVLKTNKYGSYKEILTIFKALLDKYYITKIIVIKSVKMEKSERKMYHNLKNLGIFDQTF